MENKKPKKTYKAGTLSLSLWENENNTSYSFQKAYKEDNSEEWKYTSSLSLSDLPKLKLLLEKAYEEGMLKSNN